MAAWKLDTAHSSIHFSARHMMVGKVRGTFHKFTFEVDFDPEHPELGRVSAMAEAATIDTGSPDRDAHLRSGDFLDTDRYATIAFTSSEVVPLSPDEFRLNGDLTIRDTTLPVIFDVEFLGVTANLDGGRTAGFTAKTSIGRHDFGLVWNAALEAGGVAVSDEIKIEIDVELLGPAASPPEPKSKPAKPVLVAAA